MKVLFWMGGYFDRHTTSEHLLSAVIEKLCQAGHTVHILQKKTGGSLPPIPERLAGYAVTSTEIPFQIADKTNFAARYLSELRYIRSCEKYISKDYDAVFVQSMTVTGFAVKALRRKLPKAIVTCNVQDIFPYNAAYSGTLKQSSPVFRILAGLQRAGYRRADHVITISEDMKDTLVADGTPAEKIEVVYNWSYQDELYDDMDLSPVAHLFPEDCFHAVYAGNIGVMQNVDVVVEAARLLKDDTGIRFLVIGDGVYRAKLEQRAKDYGITNISFRPMQPSELAPLIYHAADVNVIPLVKNVYKTALPSKTATCLACRQPVIFAIGKDSRFGQRVAQEAGCAVVESDSPEELAAAIRQIKENGAAQDPGAFFLRHCLLTENSRQYANIITEASR